MKTMLPSTELLGSSKVELHYLRPHTYHMHQVASPECAVDVLRKYVHKQQLDLRESFWVMLLSNANHVLGLSEVATGTSCGVQPNPKYIFQLALLTNATAIILAHNHPSGTLTISQSDIKETKKIQTIATMMDMRILDHIIITSESFVSMVHEGKL